VSSGYSSPTYTVHHWSKTRLVNIPATRLSDGTEIPAHQAWEHLFKCFKTGAERRWGLVLGPAQRQPTTEEVPVVVFDATKKAAAALAGIGAN
jgi:hypothetical protein